MRHTLSQQLENYCIDFTLSINQKFCKSSWLKLSQYNKSIVSAVYKAVINSGTKVEQI